MTSASAFRAAAGAVLVTFVLAPAGAASPDAGGPPAASAVPVAAACAATPQEAWTTAQKAVAANDAGLATEMLSPEYRTRNALETAIGASMVTGISGLAGASGSPAKAAAAAAAEAKLDAELDALLRKYKAPTIKEIGTPLLEKLEDPAVLKKFSTVDHVGLAREMEAFFRKVEDAAAAAGVKGERTKLDEVVVGGGDLKVPASGIKVAGDTATLPAGNVTMRFRKIAGCWAIDGRG